MKVKEAESEIEGLDSRFAGAARPNEYQQLAIDIAIDSAWTELDCSTLRHGKWFDLKSADSLALDSIVRAVRFLEIGGHLERHHLTPSLVRRKS